MGRQGAREGTVVGPEGRGYKEQRRSPVEGGDVGGRGDGDGTSPQPPPPVQLMWPGRLARASLGVFHVAVATICVVAVAYSWLGVGGVDYSAPPLARTAAEERAFKVERERRVGRAAARGMLKSAPKGARCCGVGSGGEGESHDDEHLTRCANVTAPLTRTTRVAVVTQATASIDAYARYANAINAVYAAHRGYSFTVFGDEPNLMPRSYEYRYGKVPLLLRLMKSHPKVGMFLWIDADAIVLDHSYDVVARLANKHPGKDIIGCREALISTNNVINSGTLLLRNTPWTLAFLRAWMDQPDALIGAPDQHTFDMLWGADHLGVRAKTALLPANAFNSEPPFFETFQTPRQQPVLHLMGENVRVRAGIFGRAWRGLCARSSEEKKKSGGGGEGKHPYDIDGIGGGGGGGGGAAGGGGGDGGGGGGGGGSFGGGGEGVSCAMNAQGQHVCSPMGQRDNASRDAAVAAAAAAAGGRTTSAASDWPVHLDWMMREYASANRGVAEDVAASPRSRVEAYNRLGVLLSNGGDFRGRLACHEAALDIKRAQYGYGLGVLHGASSCAYHLCISHHLCVCQSQSSSSSQSQSTSPSFPAPPCPAFPICASRLKNKKKKKKSSSSCPARGHPEGDMHDELAHELQVIGNHYSMFDRHDDAVEHLSRALRINRQRRDPKGDPMRHLESASLGDLASALMRKGDAKKAIESYGASLAIEMELYGEVHKNTADTLFNMGMAYDRIGQPKEAGKYLRRASAGYEKFLSPEHPALLRTRANLNLLKRGHTIHGQGQEAARGGGEL